MGGLRLSRLWPRGAGWRSRGGVEETERGLLREGVVRGLEGDLECRLGERYLRAGLKERDLELLVLKGDSRGGEPRLRGDLDLDRDIGRERYEMGYHLRSNFRVLETYSAPTAPPTVSGAPATIIIEASSPTTSTTPSASSSAAAPLIPFRSVTFSDLV